MSFQGSLMKKKKYQEEEKVMKATYKGPTFSNTSPLSIVLKK